MIHYECVWNKIDNGVTIYRNGDFCMYHPFEISQEYIDDVKCVGGFDPREFIGEAFVKISTGMRKEQDFSITHVFN